jgi:thermitase
MDRRSFIVHLAILMVCACLPMTPVMSAAIDTLTPGQVADLGSAVSRDDVAAFQSPRWDLVQIKAEEAWPLTTGGAGVAVAVLDTGIDIRNRDLAGKVIDHISFTEVSGIDLEHGHGTFVAGLVAASAEENGVAGLAYAAALLDVQVAENNGSTNAQKVAQGILWAVDHGAKVINISIVITQPYPLLEYAVDYAWRQGCLVVAAAGNSCSSAPVYPAAYPNVIAVAATDKTGGLARWSNYGDWVTVGAPGVDILSCLPDGRSGYKNGSSFSAALVSAEAAMLFPRVVDVNQDGRTNDEVRDLIVDNCDNVADSAEDDRRINLYDAAKAADILRQALLQDDVQPD